MLCERDGLRGENDKRSSDSFYEQVALLPFVMEKVKN